MGMKNPSIVVFCDTRNKKLNAAYAERLIGEFRSQTGWKVLPGTRIYKELKKFSKGYSVSKRNVSEVAVIFRMANGLMNVNPTKD
jgi:hypothetical protein